MKKGVVVEKLKRRAFTTEFKIEAVKLITEGGLRYAGIGWPNFGHLSGAPVTSLHDFLKKSSEVRNGYFCLTCKYLLAYNSLRFWTSINVLNAVVSIN